MTEIVATVAANDVDVALEQYLNGAPLSLSCPVQRALQAHVDRVAIVFQGSWHLGEQDKVPATKGEALPAEAIDFITVFDAWAKAVRRRTLFDQEELDVAKASTPGRPGAPFHFTTELPSRPMVDPVPA